MTSKATLIALGFSELPEDWKVVPLESVCAGIFDCPHSTPKLSEAGPYLVRTQDIRDGYFNTENAARVSAETYKERVKRVIPSYGDILLSREGTYFGDAAEVPKDTLVCLGQRMVLLRPDVDVIRTSYLRIWINSNSFQKYLMSFRDGSVAERLNLTTIRKLPVIVPPMEYQDFVIDHIVPFEDKIATGRQINQTLEQIAQTFFKSWFVDFEPVKAKIEAKAAGRDPERAAMCAISGKLEPELDQLPPEQYQQLVTTAALFPDELVESEMGLIPVGWEAGTLSEMVQLIGGGTPKRSNAEFWGGDIPWFSVQDAPAGGDVFVVDTEEKITRLGLEKSSTRLLPVGTTIISARGTVGRLALIGVEMAMNQSCYGIGGAEGIGPYFNYFNLKGTVGTLQQNTHGAVFDTITRQTFGTVSCVRPTKLMLEEFENILAPLMKMVCSNVHERRTLATLRDTLLPKMLSGDLSLLQAVC
jgi:type I restriction enzyme S subunit